MTNETNAAVTAAIREFRLPRYAEVPTVGLYLEQVGKYINMHLSPLTQDRVTNSMISNYVKKRMIASPVKKLYDRDQIVYLIFIALVKNVLALDSVAQFIQLQKQTYDLQVAYDYFCDEFENLLFYVFGLKGAEDRVGVDSTDEKRMLRSAVIAMIHKFYLEKCLAAISQEENGGND